MGLLDNKQKIFQKLAENKSRQEIFTEFSDNSPEQSGKIAFAIASIPSENLRKKYLLLNLFLFSLLVGYALLACTSSFSLGEEVETFKLVLKTCIPLFLAYYVYHFHGGLYRFLALWCAIELIMVLFKEGGHPLFIYSKGAVLAAILGITIFICIKIFPHFSFLSPKKDADGKYQLG